MARGVLQRFGRYILLDKIAVGGMAEIFRAKLITEGAGRLLVIKKIQQTLSANEEFNTMFKEETKLGLQLTHPNIVQVYDFGEINESLFLAMEYIEGKSLRQVIGKLAEKQQRFPVDVATFIIIESCKALFYAHSFKDKFTQKPLNVVHRDVSPQNIMLAYDGAVKLVDFGIAKAVSNVEQTKTGVIKGKPAYLSPEQIMGEPLDGRCDIFAVGIVLWELLAGQRLFSAENDLAVLRQIQSKTIEPPSKFNPNVPKELDDIVKKILQRNRNDRYKNADEAQRDLHRVLYTKFPEFNPADLSSFVKKLFQDEIVEDKKILRELDAKVPELLKVPSPVGAGMPSANQQQANAQKQTQTPQTNQAPSNEHPKDSSVITNTQFTQDAFFEQTQSQALDKKQLKGAISLDINKGNAVRAKPIQPQSVQSNSVQSNKDRAELTPPRPSSSMQQTGVTPIVAGQGGQQVNQTRFTSRTGSALSQHKPSFWDETKNKILVLVLVLVFVAIAIAYVYISKIKSEESLANPQVSNGPDEIKVEATTNAQATTQTTQPIPSNANTDSQIQNNQAQLPNSAANNVINKKAKVQLVHDLSQSAGTWRVFINKKEILANSDGSFEINPREKFDLKVIFLDSQNICYSYKEDGVEIFSESEAKQIKLVRDRCGILAFDSIPQSQVKFLSHDGYSMEIAAPFGSLPFPAGRYSIEFINQGLKDRRTALIEIKENVNRKISYTDMKKTRNY